MQAKQLRAHLADNAGNVVAVIRELIEIGKAEILEQTNPEIDAEAAPVTATRSDSAGMRCGR